MYTALYMCKAPGGCPYWFLLICSIRSVNSLRKRWHSWVLSKVLDIMASHTGSAILGTEYRLQIVPLQKRRGARNCHRGRGGRPSHKGTQKKTVTWVYVAPKACEAEHNTGVGCRAGRETQSALPCGQRGQEMGWTGRAALARTHAVRQTDR